MHVSILLQSSATPLGGPVIKASAPRAGDPRIDPLLFPLESYQGFEHWHLNNNNNMIMIIIIITMMMMMMMMIMITIII